MRRLSVWQRRTYIHLFIVVLLVLPLQAYSGILNGLTKLNKLVKDPDINTPMNKVNLPEDIKDFTPETIKMDASGDLVIIHMDGSRTPLSQFNKRNNTAFIISQYDLPKDLKVFNSIPKKTPLFIKDKANRLYELSRNGGYKLKFKNVEIEVDDKRTLRDGFWFLQKASHKKQPRYIKITDTNDQLDVKNYEKNRQIEKVSADNLIKTISKMSNQSLILAGEIKNGVLYKGNKETGIKISELSEIAAKNDLQLMIISTDNADNVLRKISRKVEAGSKSGHMQYQTNAEFFNKLAGDDNRRPVEIAVLDDVDKQFVVQWTRFDKKQEEIESMPIGLEALPLHMSLHTITVFQPGRERQKELDSRIIENINSWLQFFIISSAVLGFIALGTSWCLWKKIWNPKKPVNEAFSIKYYLLLIVHRLLFLLIHLPVLGLFSFIWMIVYFIYRVINFILIKPIFWLTGMLLTLSRKVI